MRAIVTGSAIVLAIACLAGCSSGDHSGFSQPGTGGSTLAPWDKPAGSGSGSGSGAASKGSTSGGSGAGATGSGTGTAPTATASQDSGAPTTSSTGGDDAGTTPPPSTTETADAGPFDQFQQHNLAVVNMYRATLNVAPLVLDTELSTFALAGSQELSSDHSPHAHFIAASNDNSIWTSGFSSAAAENQGDPNGWTQLSSSPTTNELDQIDAIQLAMFDEGPGSGEAHGHYTNMMNAQYTRMGVGLLEIDGMLYLTNDFSN